MLGAGKILLSVNFCILGSPSFVKCGAVITKAHLPQGHLHICGSIKSFFKKKPKKPLEKLCLKTN